MEQKEYIGTDDYIIKKGKKSVKDPAAIEFLEKSMIVLQNGGGQHGQQQQMVLNHTEAPRSQQSADSGGTEQSAAETGGGEWVQWYNMVYASPGIIRGSNPNPIAVTLYLKLKVYLRF